MAVTPRVVAVVVTYNRRDLLERLVRALFASDPRPAEIVVVDNASTDGTDRMLRQVDGPVAVSTVRLERNTGGAGGFAAGMKEAMGRGADLVWLMDDDGVPASGCLAALLPHLGAHDFLGPVVLAEDDPQRLCFPIRLPGSATVVHELAAVRRAAGGDVLEGVVIPFNGVLVTRALVERIGVPRQEFFIWGDDVEYLWRAKRRAARVGTVVDARFLHPATDDLGTPMAWGRTTYNHSPSDLKHYCMCRNNVVNLREYVGPAGVAAFVAKTLWFYTVTRPSLRRLRLSGQAMLAGARNDFTGHRRFLR